MPSPNPKKKKLSQIKVEKHKAYADSLGGKRSFILKDGRKVKVEATKIGILERNSLGVIVFRRRTDGGADPIWFKVSVDGNYLNGDGWYGFVNPPIMVPDGTFMTRLVAERVIQQPNVKENVELASKIMIARAVGGDI